MTEKTPDYIFENLGFLLTKAVQIKDRILDAHLMPEDITSTQCKVLFKIYHFGCDRPSLIGKSLNVDNSAITRTLDRLEKKELTQRLPDPNDRRSIRVALTPKGVEVVQRATPLAMNSLDELTQALNKEELNQLRQCLKKIVRSGMPDYCKDELIEGDA
ncbi:MarR family transcriptional regulator [Vibrio rhizosphaerae]|uniref:MarR family transcriptional regulator n=1 Tax=Vibrio rhizosphaerae TaxID=398736 RepID=A0ABU4IQB1_9VIBR|nr:MarR family transcriptional regulator [Vibrio rhizosphaerae]MDW6091590.1 MarR family transcriptional regulator [Vibrio rhizosphaerae]